jgi:hypothetical protein
MDFIEAKNERQIVLNRPSIALELFRYGSYRKIFNFNKPHISVLPSAIFSSIRYFNEINTVSSYLSVIYTSTIQIHSSFKIKHDGGIHWHNISSAVLTYLWEHPERLNTQSRIAALLDHLS